MNYARRAMVYLADIYMFWTILINLIKIWRIKERKT
jgi:hypothetical protein